MFDFFSKYAYELYFQFKKTPPIKYTNVCVAKELINKIYNVPSFFAWFIGFN